MGKTCDNCGKPITNEFQGHCCSNKCYEKLRKKEEEIIAEHKKAFEKGYKEGMAQAKKEVFP